MYSVEKIVVLTCLVIVSVTSEKIYSSEGLSTTLSRVEDFSVDYDERSFVIYDVLARKNVHTSAFLLCDRFYGDNRRKLNCNLTVNTHTTDDKVFTKECLIKPPSRNTKVHVLGITVLREDRVLITYEETLNKHDSQRVTSHQLAILENCHSNYITTGHLSLRYFIIRRRSNFELIYNDESCYGNHFCKSTYDLNGTPMKPIGEIFHPDSEPFYVLFAQASDYERDDGIILVAAKSDNLKTIQVYTPIFGWNLLKRGIFEETYFYSNTNGIPMLCWEIREFQELTCHWFYRKRREELLALDVSFKETYKGVSRMISQENGKIILVTPDRKRDLIIDETAPDGRCRRLRKLDTSNVEKIGISMNDKNDLCVSYVAVNSIAENLKDYGNLLPLVYEFVSRCMKFDNSSNYISICGYNDGSFD